MKKFLLSVLTAASILTPGVAKAGNTPEDHLALWKSLQDVGVTTIYNHRAHCNDDVDGKYYIYSAMLVVCQDKMTTHLTEHSWTDNDFDTLRHEAHHVIQDCAHGTLADGETGPMFNDEDLVDFLKASSFTELQLSQLYSMMKEDGLDAITIKEELEAYTVAKDIPAADIRSKLIEFCSE